SDPLFGARSIDLVAAVHGPRRDWTVCQTDYLIERRSEGRHIRIAIFRVLSRRLVNHGFETGQEFIDEPARRWNRTEELVSDQVLGVGGIERELAGDHPEKHHAEGVDVSSLVDRLDQDLFGRHVLDGPEDAHRLFVVGLARELCHAEVEDFDVAWLIDRPNQEDVVWLKVS